MHAIVTGGSSGIGLAIVRRLVEQGARVSVIALDDEGLALLAAQPPAGDQPLHVEGADVSDREAVARAIASATAVHGPCDLLVTCAGVVRPGRFWELEDAEFEREVQVNYLGTVWPVRAVVPGMVEAGRGTIVMISSFAAILGVYGYGAYAPTKFAVRGLAETLRTELRPHGIHVACVFPTDVDTPMLAAETPLKPPELQALSAGARTLTPEAVANAVLDGIEHGRPVIFCDRSSSLLARLVAAAPGLSRRIVDRTVARATRTSRASSP